MTKVLAVNAQEFNAWKLQQESLSRLEWLERVEVEMCRWSLLADLLGSHQPDWVFYPGNDSKFGYHHLEIIGDAKVKRLFVTRNFFLGLDVQFLSERKIQVTKMDPKTRLAPLFEECRIHEAEHTAD